MLVLESNTSLGRSTQLPAPFLQATTVGSFVHVLRRCSILRQIHKVIGVFSHPIHTAFVLLCLVTSWRDHFISVHTGQPHGFCLLAVS